MNQIIYIPHLFKYLFQYEEIEQLNYENIQKKLLFLNPRYTTPDIHVS